MHVFPAYKESDLLQLPFFSVIDLYNRALEIETGDLIEPEEQTTKTITNRSNELTYNPKTHQYE